MMMCYVENKKCVIFLLAKIRILLGSYENYWLQEILKKHALKMPNFDAFDLNDDMSNKHPTKTMQCITSSSLR